MNKRLSILPLLLCALLGSCGSSSRSYVEPTGGTYDPNRSFKEKEPVDLRELVYESYKELLPDVLEPWCGRKDGCLEPFKGKKPSEIESGAFVGEEGYFPWREIREGKNPFADTNAYFYVTRTNWYVDVSNIEQGKYPCFYDHDVEPYRTYFDPSSGLYLDAVYSHGVWSYVATYRAGIGPKDLTGARIIKYLIENTLESYPYSVYFDDKHFYFMSKDIAFPNDYLDTFNQRNDMHLLYA